MAQGSEALGYRPSFHSVGVEHRYLFVSVPRLWVGIWQRSAVQQSPLRPAAGSEWSGVVSAVVVNPGRTWFRAMLGILYVLTDGCE